MKEFHVEVKSKAEQKAILELLLAHGYKIHDDGISVAKFQDIYEPGAEVKHKYINFDGAYLYGDYGDYRGEKLDLNNIPELQPPKPKLFINDHEVIKKDNFTVSIGCLDVSTETIVRFVSILKEYDIAPENNTFHIRGETVTVNELKKLAEFCAKIR